MADPLTLKDSPQYASILADLAWLDRNIWSEQEIRNFADDVLQPIMMELARIVEMVSNGEL